ncbi:MAG: glutamate--tRNA ligase [Methanobacterium sp.]|nr:glutamate--tRNA ligase [Methanobacterium sp.]
MDKTEKLIYQYALLNAVNHKGQAHSKAVVGVIMGNHAELRKDPKKILKLSSEMVEKVNNMSLEEQKVELSKLGVQESKKEKKTQKKGLADLPRVDGEVVLRFAPNPSGPLHIGHARAACLNQEYVKHYGGKLILRVEDTDPRRVDPEAYQMIPEDLKWLKVDWQEEVIQSDRIKIYHQYAEELIGLGQAYMCTCPGDEFKTLKDRCQACPCRDQSPEENLELWKKMPEMREGEAVLRVKTDLNHKNPAIRDWVAMRIVEKEHPRIGDDFKVYPMMNFSVAVDDHLMGVTHVLRGKDHLANSEKQKYLYQHFSWKIPEFIHYGRLKMEDIALSTSQARKGIEDGVYQGWDDPRLGTIRAIARRGIMQEAIQELMLEIGVKIADSTVSWKKIYGLNRNLLEDKSNRYFAVLNPVKVEIQGLPESLKGNIERLKHPDYPDGGVRELPFDGVVYLDQEDLENNRSKVLRLMDAVNIFIGDEVTYHSASLEEARKSDARIVHWVPSSSNYQVELVMPDARISNGLIEPASHEIKVGDVVQLERVGFARLDSIKDDKLTFYYAHK